MRRAGALVLLIGAGSLLSACQQAPQSVSLRSLESSGRMSFVCLGRNFQPRNIDDCPDQNFVDDEDRHLFTLVTQRTRGEVAVVDLDGGEVVDEERSVPGFNFLPVGAQPTAIVSTPGSVATFVGVAEVGKEGIFALPTSCISPRVRASQVVRDVTTWSACRLPTAPGEMALILDPVLGRTSCDGSGTPEEATKKECPADLSTETAFQGQRRKLAVALPDGRFRGDPAGIAIIDAQAVLDGLPGSYEPCRIEGWVPLLDHALDRTFAEQLPPGYTPPDPLPHEPLEPSSRPAGFAQVDDPRTGEHRLFVADLEAPVIHDLDISDPCAVKESAPLLPQSFADTARAVTTRKVAASPLTTTGQRYLYAIDELGGGTAELGGVNGGTVMIFDVTAGSADKAPIVRGNSERFPFEAPDRIAFSAPAVDVAFGLRDPALPDPGNGVGEVGILCDPDPNGDPTSPAAKYRPTPDFLSGAGPLPLRGIFGFLALSSGQVAVIDLEDFDAKCRRPISTNPSSDEDFRGCAGDTLTGPLILDDGGKGTPTVTNEVSCRAVEPHRARSASLLLDNTDIGTRAPSLSTLPKLIDKLGRSLPVDPSPAGRKNPRMLGVNFSSEDTGRAQVYVGPALYTTQTDGENPLVIDPTSSTGDQNSLVLSFAEPRSYATVEVFSAKFEGAVMLERPSAGRFDDTGPDPRLIDAGVVFCDYGVEDRQSAMLRGTDLGVLPANLEAFGDSHADFALITSDILAASDIYWTSGQVQATCGGYAGCRSTFGDRPTPLAAANQNRELRIVKATVDTLTVESHRLPHLSRGSQALSAQIACCFPDAISYEVRASNEWVVRGGGFRHNIHAKDGRCTPDKSALKALLQSRVIEVSCDPASTLCAGEGLDPKGVAIKVPKTIGLGIDQAAIDRFEANRPPGDHSPAPPLDVACMVLDPSTATQTIGQSPCIHTGLIGSFVIYRGQDPSVRDMEFDWEVRGGFVPLSVGLGTNASSTPSSMVFSPQRQELIVADGASNGIMFLDLTTLAVGTIY